MKQLIIKIISLFTLLLLPFIALVPPASANKAALMGGNFMTGFNNTTQVGTWRDPVEANPENVVEFRIQVRNEGDEEMERVQVWAVLPSASSTELIATGGIRTNNASGANAEVGDTVTVNVQGGSPVGLRLLTGHQRIFGVTNLFNCPNGCDIPDTLTTGGLEIGNVPAGQEIQLGFKAFLTQAVATPTPTPTPTPPPAGGGNSACTNNSCNASVTITQPSPTVAGVAKVKELPKTGLPLAAWLFLGGLPGGLALKRFGRNKDGDPSNPNFIWEDKEYKRDIDRQ